MIILTEVAQTLEKILNGFEPQNSENENPTPYYFQVETEGFHIDHLIKPQRDGNFIPVFISSMGGQFNPVKGLKQGSYTLQIAFYYPVRFKNDFYALGEFLVDTFVGSILNYGPISGKAVSNISVPQYGEIQNLDFKEFRDWIQVNYQKPIEVMEQYMSMQISLYLANSAPGFIYGNDVKTSLSFSFDNKTYTLEDVDWDGASLQSNCQPQSEQEEDADVPEGTSLPFGTTYGQSFKIYPNLDTKAKETQYTQVNEYKGKQEYFYKSGDNYVSVGTINNAAQYATALALHSPLYIKEPVYFFVELLKVWFAGKIQEVECNFTYKFAERDDLVYTRKCYIQSIVAPIEKGSLFSLTLTFVKRTELDDEVENNA